MTIALSALLTASVITLPAAAQTNVERHHLKYGTVIPDPTVAPYGTPGELYGCLTCHAVDTSSGGTEFVMERNCAVCHGDNFAHTVLMGGYAWHKEGYQDPYKNCTSCHGADLKGGIGPSCFTCHGATWSNHDFSGSPWLGGNNYCSVCHGVPAFDPGNVTSDPVWNHAPAPASGYSVTGSTLAAVGQPNGVSLKCLGCHEGSVAVDDFTGTQSNPPSEFIVGSAAFGMDLTQHHPVSFIFDDALAAAHGGLHNPLQAASNLAGGRTIAQDMLDDAGRLQCTSCHDQHDESKPKYLVNNEVALCFTCHDFTAHTQGMHHIPDRDHPWAGFRCTICHGTLLDGTPAEGGDGIATACTSCHNPFSAPNPPPPGHHGGNRHLPYFDCASCHADPLTGALTGNDFGVLFAPSCTECHADLWNLGNNPPDAPTMADLEGTVGKAVAFDASHITDPERDPLAFQWNFGDGSRPLFPNRSPKTSHTYEDYGTYTATLAVTDGVNSPQFVQFVVTISPETAEPGVDRWEVTTAAAPPETFTITIEARAGALVVTKDDGVNPPPLAFGIEFSGVIFWMDIWMDLSGNVFWGTRDMYFGNINRTAGTMSGVVFDDKGGVATFTATK